MIQREGLVCAACGRRFHADDFFEEIGESLACPYRASFEIEPLTEEPAGNERQADAA